MASNTFTLKPLSSLFGAEVVGLDLHSDLDADVRSELQRAWHEHSLLLFRNQSLSDAEVDRLASVFGRVTSDGPNGHRSYVSNVDPNGLTPNGELHFHSDMSFWETPLRGIMLYAYEVPPPGAGGDTRFTNVRLAYNALPNSVKRRMEGLKVVHQCTDPNIIPPERSVHPLAFPHPVTGATVIFYCPRHFREFQGMDSGETKAMRDELGNYLGREELTVTHQWRPGDLVVWDNIMLQHARTDFDPKHRRHLRRIQIEATA